MTILFKKIDKSFKELSAVNMGMSEKTVEKTVERTVEKTVEKILRALEPTPHITIKELKKQTGLTIRGVEWQIAKLKQQGKIKRIGPDKGGRWEVIEND